MCTRLRRSRSVEGLGDGLLCVPSLRRGLARLVVGRCPGLCLRKGRRKWRRSRWRRIWGCGSRRLDARIGAGMRGECFVRVGGNGS